MPMNPRKMVNRTRAEEQELHIKSELFILQNAERYSRPRKNTKMAELTSTIYDIFEQNSLHTKATRAMAATEFKYLYDLYSPNTMIKAKKILGIQSRRAGGVWWWTYPKFAPTEALTNSHNEKVKAVNEAADELRKLQKASVLAFQGIMIDHKFYAENTRVLGEMAANGYSRPTALKAKNDLNVATQKIGGKWMWVWAHRDVQDWLEDQLANGPKPHETLKLEALADHGWEWPVVLLAQKALRNIEWRIYNGTGYWEDINRPNQNQAFAALLPTKKIIEHKTGIHMLGDDVVVPVAKNSNEIVVDFEQEEDPDINSDDYDYLGRD